MTNNGLYFAVRIEDAVTTFEGLPIAKGSAKECKKQRSII